MIKIRCNDCGREHDMPEAFFSGGAMTFWEMHGHPPASITYVCECGETRDSGPKISGSEIWRDRVDAMISAMGRAGTDSEWCRAHQEHADRNLR
jgi:hypothetical protein